MQKDAILKKSIRYAGSLLVIAAVIFLIKRIVDMDVDFAKFSDPRIMAALVIGFVVQTLIIIMSTFPWLVFVQSLSGKKIPFRRAMPVFARSNFYKYVPGNVFQYIGRNQLAADMQISHVDVACATIMDILFCVAITGLVSVCLLRTAIVSLLQEYGRQFLLIGGIGIAAVLVLGILLFWKFRTKCREYLSRYTKAFRRENLPFFLCGVGYYFLHNAAFGALYVTVLRLVCTASGTAVTASELAMLTGAFMFAWIVGFITPGAPGGIGIRESVMIFVCGAAFEQEVLLFVLILRISSILADAAGFVIGTVGMKKRAS